MKIFKLASSRPFGGMPIALNAVYSWEEKRDLWMSLDHHAHLPEQNQFIFVKNLVPDFLDKREKLPYT